MEKRKKGRAQKKRQNDKNGSKNGHKPDSYYDSFFDPDDDIQTGLRGDSIFTKALKDIGFGHHAVEQDDVD